MTRHIPAVKSEKNRRVSRVQHEDDDDDDGTRRRERAIPTNERYHLFHDSRDDDDGSAAERGDARDDAGGRAS